MKQTLISIVIPLFNERESLHELVRVTNKAFDEVKKSIEYIFVDDGSTDGSYETLVAIQKKEKHSMTIVRLRRRSGKSAAMAEGFLRVKGDIVVTMDADLQDDPFEARKLILKIDEGFDLVVGWRKRRNDSKGKLGVSYIFNWAVSVLSGLHLHDMNSGLKAMKKEVVEEVHLYGELHRFIPVLAYVRGFKVTERSIQHHARKFGKSKFGIERIFAAFDLFAVLFLSGFGTRPIIVFGPPGVVLIGLGFIALIYLSILHFIGFSIGDRPLLLLGVLSVLFGLQLLSTGLLGELIISSSVGRHRPSIEKESV